MGVKFILKNGDPQMNSWRLLPAVFLLFCVLTRDASAQLQLFGKRAKVNAKERVPELLGKVKAEKDERQRVAAAAELRQYDGNVFPEIAFVLIDVLQNDGATNVRLEAAVSLARLRPSTQEVSQALHQAASKDTSLRVRMQARTSLMFYHVSASTRKVEPQGPILPSAPTPIPSPPTTVTPAQGTVVLPPLNLPRPLPTGPSQPAPIPTQTIEPPLLQPVPPSGQGPILTPPSK
jgi:hypothetical protein